MKNIVIKLITRVVFGVMSRIDMLYWRYVYCSYRQNYDISKEFMFNGTNISFYGDGIIYCGDKSYIGKHSSIQAINQCKVKIGNNCKISHFVSIYTYNNAADQNFINPVIKKFGNVVIGNDCWIGIKASIFGPVTIGENAVIGANSMVNRDIPPHSIAVGVPAKVVKFKSYLSEIQKVALAKAYENVLSDDLLQRYKVR